MRAINKAMKVIETTPESDEARALQDLVLALESGEPYRVSRIYELDYKHYELALGIIADWRLDRHYSSKFRLISAALHARSVQS